MNILSIKANNRRRCFEVHSRGKDFVFPFAKCDPSYLRDMVAYRLTLEARRSGARSPLCPICGDLLNNLVLADCLGRAYLQAT